MDRAKIIILNAVNQPEKITHDMILLICGILKNDTNELVHKTEIRPSYIENKLMFTKGERREGQLRSLGYRHCYI